MDSNCIKKKKKKKKSCTVDEYKLDPEMIMRYNWDVVEPCWCNTRKNAQSIEGNNAKESQSSNQENLKMPMIKHDYERVWC